MPTNASRDSRLRRFPLLNANAAAQQAAVLAVQQAARVLRAMWALLSKSCVQSRLRVAAVPRHVPRLQQGRMQRPAPCTPHRAHYHTAAIGRLHE
eukprot:7081574-Prymnesium_polylepis.1